MHLVFDYYIKPVIIILKFQNFLSILLIIGLSTAVYKLYKKKSAISKIALFSILWFFITLSPTSSFFPTTLPMDIKRLYLPSFGFFLAMVTLCFWTFNISFNNKKENLNCNWISLGLLAIIASFYGVNTYNRNQQYQNPLLLWNDVINKFPNNDNAYINRGELHYRKKRYSKSIQDFKMATKINFNNAIAHYNLGVLYHEQGNYEKAIQEYKRAIEMKPNYAEAHYNLAKLYSVLKYHNKAIQEYYKTIKLNYKNAEIYNNIGVAYHEQGNYEKAIQGYKRAIEMKPNYAEAHNNLGALYNDLKNYNKSIREYEKAIEHVAQTFFFSPQPLPTII